MQYQGEEYFSFFNAFSKFSIKLESGMETVDTKKVLESNLIALV